MTRRYIYILLLLSTFFIVSAQDSFQVVCYNVENLFDCSLDTLNGIKAEDARDYAYSPNGERHWTYSKYQRKLQHISQVIANIGGWNTPALVGLLEVENAHCLADLTRHHLSSYQYHYLHRDGPDTRGIDCALLYDSKQFKLLDSAFLSIPLSDRPTREIIYAKGIMTSIKDTLHIFVCHLPSQLGGAAHTAHRRAKAFALLQEKIDTILHYHPLANIIVMGDMNTLPQDNLLPLRNRMLNLQSQYNGTNKFQGQWSYLDQFYTAGRLLEEADISVFSPDWLLEDDTKFGDKQPARTYQGFRYQYNGYSDHLPIVLTIAVPRR